MTPDQWLRHLAAKIESRQADRRLWARYHDGRPPIPDIPAHAKREYRRLLTMARANIVRPVIGVLTERLHVDGVDHPDQSIADAAWQIWKRSRMPAMQSSAYVDAAVRGSSVLTVSRRPDGTARIHVDDSCWAAVDVDPADPYLVRAGLRMWTDRIAKVDRADLFLPGVLHSYRRRAGSSAALGSGWVTDGSAGAPADLDGQVPMVEMLHRPDLRVGGLSEVADLVPIQDRVNKTLFDRLMVQEDGASRARWATGLELPVDPSTGQPIQPEQASLRRMSINPEPDGRFGVFEASELGPFLETVAHELEIAARVKEIPPHTLTAKGEFPSGDALRSAEATIVMRSATTATSHGDTIEAALAIGLRMQGHRGLEPTDLSARWRNPETRTYGEAADWAAKLAAVGVPVEVLLPRLGFSRDEIDRALSEQRVTALLGAVE